VGSEVVRVEVRGWLIDLLELGPEGPRRSARVVLTVPLPPSATLGAVLAAATQGHPRLEKILWESKGERIGESINILVGSRLFEVAGGLEQRVAGAIRVVLIPAYAGG